MDCFLTGFSHYILFFSPHDQIGEELSHPLKMNKLLKVTFIYSNSITLNSIFKIWLLWCIMSKPISKIGQKLTMPVEYANQSHAHLMICHLPFVKFYAVLRNRIDKNRREICTDAHHYFVIFSSRYHCPVSEQLLTVGDCFSCPLCCNFPPT